ncbi:hypothetical protein K5I29_05445 [Flavobacterium agricola]|uniref:Uncharacterized protein n=1 Tax=Flavobacterium agricola TaxID=2870839 RepID=A0ABY6M1B6_9FLAO|nr:hypothetical protein [Flavobacterium agricola]UYW02343.1 hypothetical protein K5I29_05445 [Flavobacterium agricola]
MLNVVPSPSLAEGTIKYKSHQIANLCSLKIPEFLNPFRCDIFRAISEDGLTELSVTIFEKPYCNEVLNASFLKQLKAHQLVNSDFSTPSLQSTYKITDNYLTTSFNLDNEIQYNLTSTKVVNNRLMLCEIIYCQHGSCFDSDSFQVLENINNSIQFH